MTANSPNRKYLGHGDHWVAVGIDGAEKIADFLQSGMAGNQPVATLNPPWPRPPFRELVILERLLGLMNVTSILGRNSSEETWKLLSAFPTMKGYEEWVVQIDGVSNCYGAVEGCVEGIASAGHPLKCFDPYFGLSARAWRLKGFVRVKLSALALRLVPYPGEPFDITEGPRIEELRKELRAEGKFAEAERNDLKLTIQTDQMRTLYSNFHDHHTFVGKVIGKRSIKPLPEFQGHILDVEVMPDQLSTGWKLPVYAFPGVLGSYQPKRGDLIQGTVWLQGSWGRAARPPEKTAWRNQAISKPLS
jgi:hypothetical protein